MCFNDMKIKIHFMIKKNIPFARFLFTQFTLEKISLIKSNNPYPHQERNISVREIKMIVKDLNLMGKTLALIN